MRCYRTQGCVIASGGCTLKTAHSNSPPRTKNYWPACGAGARATARPWPTRRWRVPCATTPAPARYARWRGNWRIGSTRTPSVAWGTAFSPHLFEVTWQLWRHCSEPEYYVFAEWDSHHRFSCYNDLVWDQLVDSLTLHSYAMTLLM